MDMLSAAAAMRTNAISYGNVHTKDRSRGRGLGRSRGDGGVGRNTKRGRNASLAVVTAASLALVKP